MSVIFISKNCLLQGMLEKVCEAQTDLEIIPADTVGAIPSPSEDDIVLLHLTSSREQITAQITELHAFGPNLRLVLLVQHDLIDDLSIDLSPRLHAIIPENTSLDTLIGALIVVQNGYRLIKNCPDLQAGKSSHATIEPFGPIPDDPKRDACSKEASLSKRERMILTRLSKGGSNKDIANALGIQETTVKVHLRACYRKIGARNRTQAAVWAAERLPY